MRPLFTVAARRLHRFLRAVGRDILRADRLRVDPQPDGIFSILMDFLAVRLCRRVLLSAAELALLREEPALHARLAPVIQ